MNEKNYAIREKYIDILRNSRYYNHNSSCNSQIQKKGVMSMNNNSYMLDADQIAEWLQCSKGHAYKVIRELNAELKAKGFIVVAGKIPRAFWEEKF